MQPTQVAQALEAELRGAGTPERATHDKAYLKSDLDFLGAGVPTIRRAAEDLARRHPDLQGPPAAWDGDQLFALVDACWTAGIHELRGVAVELLVLADDRLGPADADRLETLIRQAGTWALVDPLATAVAGSLLERHPVAMDAAVRRWATDGSFWVRRASLLAHLPALRRGDGDFDRFAELADGMLDEREFFVRKAIGWVLRETGKRHAGLVVGWLEPRIGRAAGVTVREAVKYLPAADRERLLAAHRRK